MELMMGDDITIEEMPQGCVLYNRSGDKLVVIHSQRDAFLLIDSLARMLEAQHLVKTHSLRTELEQIEKALMVRGWQRAVSGDANSVTVTLSAPYKYYSEDP